MLRPVLNTSGQTGSPVLVCGSRELWPEGVALVDAVTRSLAASGGSIVTGCAVGADLAALRAARAVGGRVQVLAAFGPRGVANAGRASAVAAVCRAAAAGVPVTWWAGGPASVPLRARLAHRSLAAVRQVAAQRGPGSRVVAIISSLPRLPWQGAGPWYPCGSGAWSTIVAGAALGLPVVVFPVGLARGASLPALPTGPGSWVPAGAGLWSAGWAWSPGAALL